MFLSIRFRRIDVRAFAFILFVMIAAPAAVAAAGGPAAGPQGTPQPAPAPGAPAPATAEPETAEQNVAMDTFLQFLNKSQEATLRQHKGLTKEVVDSIMANRAAGKSFASPAEFRKITKISSANFEAAFKPFFEADLRKTTLAATRKPIQPVTAPDPNAAAPGSNAPSGGAAEGPIGAVRAGYYAQLEGYTSWDGVDPAVKKEFFETINRERCTCGCTNETLAWCYVNDTSCPVVRPRVKKIHDDLMKRAAAAPPAAGSTTPK